MKSAYERAMERFGSEPTVTLTDEQKKELAELDSIYAAKLAEKELTIKSETAKAMASQDFHAVVQLEQQMISARKTLNAELEEKKEKVRQRKES